jgi:hypothetical protein
MSQKRKLAAIMFSDIVDYSSLMSKDELQAMRLLNKNREIHRSHIEKFTGGKKDIRDIGKKLNVVILVECSIRKAVLKPCKKKTLTLGSEGFAKPFSAPHNLNNSII